MEVVTLGELLAEFPSTDTGLSLARKRNFVGPFPAGAPAIFAVTVVRLGRSCGYIGTVGDDDFGKMIVDKLRDEGVDTRRIRMLEDYTTGTSFVAYDEKGNRKFLFHMDKAAPGQLSPDDVVEPYLENADFLHIAGSTLSINESNRNAVYKAVKIAEKEDINVTFDPNVRTELLDVETIRDICEPVLQSCDYLLSNEEELNVLIGGENSIGELFNKGIETVIIKRGERGSTAVREVDRIDAPPFAVKEVDPTGAGDSFDAAFVHCLLNEKSMEESLRFANAVGAISVTERGGMGNIPTEGKVAEFLKGAGECT